MSHRSVAPFALVLVLALALASCRGETDDGTAEDDLREHLQAQAVTQEDLADRLAALEDEVARLDDELAVEEEPDAISSLEESVEGLDGRLRALSERVETIDAGLNDEATARESTLAELRALTGDLQDAVDEVRGALQGIRRDVGELRDEHELLKARFDNHGH
jgi:archaellum component FlaC